MNKNEIAPKKPTGMVPHQSYCGDICEAFLGDNFPRIEAKTKIAFLEMAKAFNLNPFKREIYLVGYKGKNGDNYNIIVGYEVYISRAMASGMLNGWQIESGIERTFRLVPDTWEVSEHKDLVATCTIWRKDFEYPFKKSVNFGEYAQKTFDRATGTHKINAMWRDKPKTMLEKVATAQAFRLAFPDELGGIGYQAEELGHDSTVIPQSREYKKPQSKIKEAQIVAIAEPGPGNLSEIEEIDSIEELNTVLGEYFEHKNPEIKKAIWENAKRRNYYYDSSGKKFLLTSPISEEPSAIEGIEDELKSAKDQGEFNQKLVEIYAGFGENVAEWPQGLADIVNQAAKYFSKKQEPQESEDIF